MKGLSEIVNDFLEKLPKSGINSLNQSTRSISSKDQFKKILSTQNSYRDLNRSNSIISTISKAVSSTSNKQMTSKLIKDSFNFLENIYNKLGHEVYSKFINIFEKYCLYGKTHTNFNLDFQQFTHFTTKNEIYNEFLTKSQGEFIFNRVKKENKCIIIFIQRLILKNSFKF